MDLTPELLDTILHHSMPRHLRDFAVAPVTARAFGNDRIVLVLRSSVEFQGQTVSIDPLAHGLTLSAARALYNRVGEVIDQVELLD